VRRLIERILPHIERLLRMAAPVLERIASVGFLQSAVVMAAQTFLALFPLLIAVIAIAPVDVGQTISSVARDKLGLVGQTSDEVNRLVGTRDQLHGTITAFGVIVVLVSATSFTRALQRVYESSWQIPRLGLRGSLRGLGWLVGLIAYFGLLGLALRITANSTIAVTALRQILLVLMAYLLWWLTPFILLCGRVRLRALVVTGALTAVIVLVAARVSATVMPRIISTNERQYGTIGAVFAIESWLVVIAALIVGCAILGALAAQAESRVGRWARGPADPQAWRRVPGRLLRRRAAVRLSESPQSSPGECS
jgi:membrane protein